MEGNDQFYSPSRLHFDKTPELEVELQANIDCDFEQQYLQMGITKMSPRSARGNTQRTDRTKVSPLDHYSSLLASVPRKGLDESTLKLNDSYSTRINLSQPPKKSAVQNLLVFFHFKRFYNKIAKSL
jgi:hypothetical protein